MSPPPFHMHQSCPQQYQINQMQQSGMATRLPLHKTRHYANGCMQPPWSPLHMHTPHNNTRAYTLQYLNMAFLLSPPTP